MDEDKIEITNSLNGMLGSKSITDMKMASTIIKNQPDLVDQNTIQWYNIQDYVDLEKSVKLTELYSSEGGSDKVYIVNINKDNKIYRVEVFYGRRGKKLRKDVKYTGKDLMSAFDYHNTTVSDKTFNKNYKLISEE